MIEAIAALLGVREPQCGLLEDKKWKKKMKQK